MIIKYDYEPKYSEYIVLAVRVGKWYNPIDGFLMSQLKSRYIHTELIFYAELMKKYGINMHGKESFSSRGRTRNVYPRKRGCWFANVDYSKGEWIFIVLTKIRGEEILKAYQRAMYLVGRKYDRLGAILNCGLDLPYDNKKRDWCSESNAYVLQPIYDLKTDNLKPGELLQLVVENQMLIK